MARFSYYLSGELFIDSDLSIPEIENLLNDILTVTQNGVSITPVSIDIHSPRRA